MASARTSSARSPSSTSAAAPSTSRSSRSANGVFEVISTAGDTFLGGEDFDKRIIDWLVFGFAKEHKIDLRKDKMALQRLKDVAEKAKCELSSGARRPRSTCPFIISTGTARRCTCSARSRASKLEELTTDLIERAMQICEKTLQEAEHRRRATSRT